MKVVKKFILFAVVILLVVSSIPATMLADTTSLADVTTMADSSNQMVSRLGGSDRYEVAAGISNAEYPNGTSTVVLVNGSDDKLADGLAATPLAKALNAPILLIGQDTVPDATANEITRLNATVFYVIGGPGSVSDSIVNRFGATRIGGKDRYEVAMNVANKLKDVKSAASQGAAPSDTFTKAFICNGLTYADALAISPIAAMEGDPVLFVSSTDANTTANVKSYISSLGVSSVDAIGGPASMDDDILSMFSAKRVSGANREALSASIASSYYHSPGGLFVVNGYCPADALSIGPYAANFDYPILYVGSDGKSVDQTVQDYASANNLSFTAIYVVGGTASVSDTAISKISLGYTGLQFFDTDTKLNLDICQKFKSQGYDGAIRYIGWGKYANDPGDLTKDEMNAIFQSGLGLMVVQHCRASGWVPTAAMGKQDAQTAVSELSNIGAPNFICVWLDLEGVKSGTPKQQIIDFCNAWYNEIKSSGYVPGIYIGFNNFLTSSDLFYSLNFQHYWRSLSTVPDVAERGYQMEQSGVAGYVNGITIDLDKVFIDRKGDSIVYWANGSLQSPSPKDITPSK